MSTYDKPFNEFNELFSGRNISGYNLILETGTYPIEAYRVFKSKEAADIIVAGDEKTGNYDIYPGAVVSVIEDASVENNGLYHVELADTTNPESGYKLVKMLSEEDASISGQITVLLKNETGVAGLNGESSIGWNTPADKDVSINTVTPYIYFVGVDSSVKEQHPDILYFNDGIVYDASGSNLFQNSDERLKNVVANIEPNLDELRTIDKVVFNWKQDESHKNNIGVIAQTVEKLYPELVIENPDSGYKMVNYAGLSVIALAAVDKLYEKVQDLEAEVTRLKSME